MCQVQAEARKRHQLIDSNASSSKFHAVSESLVAATDVGIANKAILKAMADKAVKELQKKKQ